MKSGEVKLFLGILIVALVLVGFAVYPVIKAGSHIVPPKPEPRPELNKNLLAPKGSHVTGSPNGPFTLVEFGDYECPTCKKQSGNLKAIMKVHHSKLTLVYHHIQISPAHKNSYALATAAYAAAQQGKFWQMHEQLYEAQDSLRDQPGELVLQKVTEMAGKLKLDVLKFRSDMVSEGAKKSIAAEREIADKAKVDGTPSFYFVPPSGPPKYIPQDLLKDYLAKEANWK